MRRMVAWTMVTSLALASLAAPAAAKKSKGFFGDLVWGLSVGLGSGAPVNDQFDASFNPGFGALLDASVRKGWVELAADFDYSFFFREGIDPRDANVSNAFLLVKIKPLRSKARPYVLAGGGYYRYWIVDENLYEGVLGAAAGVGVEAEINKHQHIFLEFKYTQGRTREANADRANTEAVVGRLGLTWLFR